MNTIIFSKKAFIPELVAMLYAPSKVSVLTEVQLLTKLIEYSKGGVIVVSEVKSSILSDLSLKENHFRQILHKLAKGKHIKVEYGIIYISPKYSAIKSCEGKLMIQRFDGDILTDEKAREQILSVLLH